MSSPEGLDFLMTGALSLMQKATRSAMTTGTVPKRKGMPRNIWGCCREVGREGSREGEIKEGREGSREGEKGRKGRKEEGRRGRKEGRGESEGRRKGGRERRKGGNGVKKKEVRQ